MQNNHQRLIHRLIARRYGITSQTVINTGPPPTDISEPVAADLNASMHRIQAATFHSENGRARVDYARLKDSEIYTTHRQCALRLQTFDPVELSTREERLAFWINAYNALLIDAVIAYEIKRSVQEMPGFFWRAAYNINGVRFNTMDIENGILRANAGHPAIPGPHFTSRDPRLTYSLDTLDPRIHFALVCASHSCPPIAVYDAHRIDEQLDVATRAFVNGGGAEIDTQTNTIHLSRIFQWYASDFGGSTLRPKSTLEYITPFLNDTSADWLNANRNRAKIRYQKYDWTLNGFLKD
jgi:hypothetical protein